MSDAAAISIGHDLLGPPERLHPLYLLTGLGQALRGAWGMLAAGAYFASQGSWLLVGAIALSNCRIGPPSSWNTPSVSPRAISSYVFSSASR